MLSFRGVSKAFHQTLALDAIDLSVEPGRTTVLIGPSGCGKSTLLRLALGLISPTKGSIHFGDSELVPGRLLTIRRHVGYVIQSGGLFPHFTARQNVTLMARQLRWTRERIERRVSALAALTRFPIDGLSRFPVQLSGGQRQRVSLMRALMLDPDLLLLDEPLGALDPMIRSELQQDLREIFRSLGKTVLLVTHDMAEAGYFADTIVLLNRGRIVQKGTYRDLTRAPADEFVTSFIRAQRNQAEGTGTEEP